MPAKGRRSPDPAACAAAYPYFGAPRIAVGGLTTHDNAGCELAPLPDTAPTDGSYGSAPFALDQWERLKATFPDGVCDWRRPLRAGGDAMVRTGSALSILRKQSTASRCLPPCQTLI
jgi:hypothetical protein